MNLGYLHEKPLGVEEDPMTALDRCRKGAVLGYVIAIDPVNINTKASEELKERRREVERTTRELQSLSQQLEQIR